MNSLTSECQNGIQDEVHAQLELHGEVKAEVIKKTLIDLTPLEVIQLELKDAGCSS